MIIRRRPHTPRHRHIWKEYRRPWCRTIMDDYVETGETYKGWPVIVAYYKNVGGLCANCCKILDEEMRRGNAMPPAWEGPLAIARFVSFDSVK